MCYKYTRKSFKQEPCNFISIQNMSSMITINVKLTLMNAFQQKIGAVV